MEIWDGSWEKSVCGGGLSSPDAVGSGAAVKSVSLVWTEEVLGFSKDFTSAFFFMAFDVEKEITSFLQK